ncbi:MAG: DUF2232 domain-containing protein [Spirochaetia bacterium]|nr:DUF2232 domain-containing protein [Spirochaetia bacterium]
MLSPRSNETLRYVVIPTLIAIVLYWITSSSFLSVIVLLLASKKAEAVSKSKEMVPIIIVILFVIGYHYIQLQELLEQRKAIGLFIIGLYLPISTLVAGSVWIATERERMLYRLLYASFFATVVGFFIVLWLSGTSASALYTKEVYMSLITSLVTFVMNNQLPMNDMNELGKVVISVITNFGLTLFIAQFGVAVFISDMIIHRYSIEYQNRLMRLSVPHEAIWFLLAGMSAILFTFLVEIKLLESIAYNVSTVVALLYAVQGISIASNYLVKKFPHMKPSRIFFLSGAFMILPGANIIFIIGFPLLGISETWITYRKNE